MNITKKQRKSRIHYRIRKKVRGSADRPRLTVYRSNTQIYCQLINDDTGHTICTISSKKEDIAGSRTEKAKQVGMKVAAYALDHDIDSVVFDRGGYLYHGRVKALAEGAREKGLKF